jgi:hypothetical protein
MGALTAASSALVELGTYAGITAAVVTALTLLSKAKPVRWVFRMILSDPVTRWATRTVDGVTRPQIDEVKAASRSQHDEQNVRIDGIHRRLDEGSTAIAALTQAVDAHNERIVAVEQTVTHTTITNKPGGTSGTAG